MLNHFMCSCSDKKRINMSTWEDYLKEIYYHPANPASSSGHEY